MQQCGYHLCRLWQVDARAVEEAVTLGSNKCVQGMDAGETWAEFHEPQEPWMGLERELTIGTEIHRINLEVLCGKDLRQGLEHFTTWKALLNIHKKSSLWLSINNF